jgi:hypothetical protein
MEAHQYEINNRRDVGCVAKVLVVSSRESRPNTMMIVHHTSHSVEAETVKLIFLDPEPEIREQEAENLMVPIVEQPTIKA